MKMSKHEKSIRNELDAVNIELDELEKEESRALWPPDSGERRRTASQMLMRLLLEVPTGNWAGVENGDEAD